MKYYLMTRQQIIDKWLEQDKEKLSTYCCPNCRDLLYPTGKKNVYTCQNMSCSLCFKDLENAKED